MFDDLIDKGSSFHSFGPAAEKALSPYHDMSSEMSLGCSRVFVKKSAVNENRYDDVKVQKYKQELNRISIDHPTSGLMQILHFDWLRY